MIITLLGFSGVGKSHLSAALAKEYGWRWICCDDLIEERLRNEHDLPTERGIHSVADWLGFPDEDGFVDRERSYLKREDEIMAELAQQIQSAPPSSNTVIDASGSLVYCKEEVIQALAAVSTFVYLRVGDKDDALLLKQYLENPKPVLWLDNFKWLQAQTRQTAISQCFPALFQDRKRLYEALAEKTIPVTIRHRETLTAKRFLEELHKQ